MLRIERKRAIVASSGARNSVGRVYNLRAEPQDIPSNTRSRILNSQNYAEHMSLRCQSEISSQPTVTPYCLVVPPYCQFSIYRAVIVCSSKNYIPKGALVQLRLQ